MRLGKLFLEQLNIHDATLAVRGKFDQKEDWSLSYARFVEILFGNDPAAIFELESLANRGRLRFDFLIGDKRVFEVGARKGLSLLNWKPDASCSMPFVLSTASYVQILQGAGRLTAPAVPAYLLFFSETDFSFTLLDYLCGMSTVENVHANLGRVAAQFASMLLSIGLLENFDKGRNASESIEFHETLFHWSSRICRHGNRIGATKVEPLPSRGRHYAEWLAGTPILLPKLDFSSEEALSISFTSVVDSRRSERTFSVADLPINVLGELLDGCFGRAGHLSQIDRRYESSNYEPKRLPYGGGISAFDVLLLIQRVSGLKPGLYLYNDTNHYLQLLDVEGEYRTLVSTYSRVIRSDPGPNVIVLLSTDIQRKSCRYSGVSYSLILKEVGIAFYSLYLWCTALNLAGCAMGAGPTQVGSLPEIDEKPVRRLLVGEFAVGLRADSQ